MALQLKRIYKQLRGRKVRNASSGIYAGLAGLACLGILAMFVARGMRENNPPPAVQNTVVASSSSEREVGVWVDLTKGLEMSEATRSGQWWNADGTLISNNKLGSLIQFDASPTGSYVIECAYTRVSGEGEIVLIVPSSTGLLSVSFGTNFMQIPELGNNRNGISENINHNFQLGVVYTVAIDVTNSEIVARVDGNTWAVWSLEATEKKLQEKWSKAEEGKLALGVDGSQVLFSKLRMQLK